jgi:hypothetical protein
MQKLPLILAGAVAFTLPMAAQVTRVEPDQNVHLQSVVCQQDREDRQQGDQDDNYRRDRDREYNEQRNDRDRDRDHDRGNGQYGQYDRGGYGRKGYEQYHNVLAPEWQQKFDSYYQRWLRDRASNHTGEMASMEKRMQDIMVHYNIPSNVPYDQVASPGIGGYGNGQYGRGDRDRYGQGGYYGQQGGYGHYGRGEYGQYHNVLAPEWQQKFDSYYRRWLQDRASNNTGEMASMENRMRDIMTHYNIPSHVPFDEVASPGAGGNRY